MPSKRRHILVGLCIALLAGVCQVADLSVTASARQARLERPTDRAGGAYPGWTRGTDMDLVARPRGRR
jgi:hypothetical protein